MFIQENYDKNDKRAKDKAIELLSRRYIVKENPDQYDVDLICYNESGDVCYYIEVEVKNLWNGDTFPWDDINCLTRKEKYYKKHKNTKLMLFNTDLSSCFIIDGEIILSCPKVEVPNRRYSSGEYFFKVPVNKAILHKKLN